MSEVWYAAASTSIRWQSCWMMFRCTADTVSVECRGYPVSAFEARPWRLWLITTAVFFGSVVFGHDGDCDVGWADIDFGNASRARRFVGR